MPPFSLDSLFFFQLFFFPSLSNNFSFYFYFFITFNWWTHLPYKTSPSQCIFIFILKRTCLFLICLSYRKTRTQPWFPPISRRTRPQNSFWRGRSHTSVVPSPLFCRLFCPSQAQRVKHSKCLEELLFNRYDYSGQKLINKMTSPLNWYLSNKEKKSQRIWPVSPMKARQFVDFFILFYASVILSFPYARRD